MTIINYNYYIIIFYILPIQVIKNKIIYKRRCFYFLHHKAQNVRKINE